MTHDKDMDARLSRLADATAGVRPRSDFSARVMQRIAIEPPSLWSSLGTPARRFFPVGMLAAALAVFWAVSVNDQVNEALASGDDTELTW